ncbi:double-strand break repair helicase AddA [Devosia submarina]|uniref:double-strand break repair helicase AddA n=1 Tax=Devosia submarina TaxID=1173082 RepID=UPI0013006588|nr:double-strand break repair helicase AddA [Devosia submarina]
MSGERGALQVPFDTARNQAQAANPGWSIWVSANAGSGKTYVLTQRVLRMLLAGVKPEAILCLTYTKAAAAEMRRRVAQRLGAWAVLEPALLEKELVAIEGDGLTDEMRERARTLFARALETPGGLKIVTIHAFCESVLHRFPLEAGVPFDFSVIEDEERNGMVLQARERVLAEGLNIQGAVETLFETLSNSQIEGAIDAALSDGRKLKAVLRDIDRSKHNLRRLLQVGDRTEQDVVEEILGGTALTPAVFAQFRDAFDGNPEKGNRFVDLLARLDPKSLTAGQICSLFMTDKADGTRGPRSNLLNAAQKKARPDLFALVEAEQERVAALDAELMPLRLGARSEAVLDIVAAIAKHYEDRKRARSLLDFDDLVSRLANLFETQSADWVRYKLDAGIDHILVDESQDTNGEQWRVVKAITAEFFSGAGAVDRPRSLFAVGDQKQSIYSFQGAEPKLFGETGREYAQLAENVQAPFKPLPLHTSFRTLPEILQAVDLVSDAPHIQAALLEQDKVHHNTARTMVGGSVTLWPPVQQGGDAAGGSEWPITALEGEQTAPRQVAMRIAREIDGWIKAQRPLTGRGRAVCADDVMILVQSRGPLFAEIIRALRKLRIPTPGADRLNVTGHIAVMDLLALCDVLLNPADNLQLAALLRSPLFDVTEEELFELSQRAEGETLWQALEHCKAPLCQDAADRLHRWRGALDFERPFEFLAQVLYAEGGLKRFHARMGTEVDDVFAELLALAIEHEQTNQPSLQGFVSNLRTRSVSVKRELAEIGGGVRVMTVHGAKGLEAPIVILADASKKPMGQQISKPVYLLADTPGPLLIHAAGTKAHVPGTLPHKQEIDGNILAEYWRRLYVGMTRAEDELYVTGALTPGTDRNTQLAGSWYEAIETALRPHAESVVDEDGRETALIFPHERVPPAPAKSVSSAARGPLDGLELARVPEPVVPLIVSPSTARGHLSPIQALDSLLEQTRDPDQARREGVVLHALLQHLVPIDRLLWPQIVPKALLALLPEAPERHEFLGNKAMSILQRPELAWLFARNSRAEVPFLVHATRDGEPIRLAGRIDRLVVDEEGVTVIDYKSDASVPQRPEDAPGNYVTQLGLYALVAGQLFPGRQVHAAILWTQLESLMNLPPDLLAAGSKGFTMR